MEKNVRGNLSLPAPNARGLGSIPWQVHKASDGEYYRHEKTIYGNTRLSFETTNAVMFPVIQAQELSHPFLAEEFGYEIEKALTIPNEEIQFEEISLLMTQDKFIFSKAALRLVLLFAISKDTRPRNSRFSPCFIQ